MGSSGCMVPQKFHHRCPVAAGRWGYLVVVIVGNGELLLELIIQVRSIGGQKNHAIIEA